MSFLNALLADLKERRLWPLGLGLLVAIIAVPVVLSQPASESPSEEAPQASTGTGAGAVPGDTQPVVSLAGPAVNFRKDLGRLGRKNPFAQQAQSTGQENEGLSTPSDSGLSSGGGAAGDALAGTGGETGTTVPTTPGTGGGTEGSPQGKLVYLTYSVRGSFGEVGSTRNLTLKTPRSLPTERDPVAIFIGVERGKKAAVFAVASDVTAHGDGDCEPSKSTCTFVRLKKGDVEFFEVPNADGQSVTTYELDVNSIKLGVSNSPPKKAPASDEKQGDGKAAASRKARRHPTLSALPGLPF